MIVKVVQPVVSVADEKMRQVKVDHLVVAVSYTKKSDSFFRNIWNTVRAYVTIFSLLACIRARHCTKIYILVCACQSISVCNRWMNGTLSRATKYNGRYSWVDKTKTFAIWYDGQRGAFFDWMFGFAKRIGSSSKRNALMFSNEETLCPHSVSTWVNDNSAQLSCISQITTVSKTITTTHKGNTGDTTTITTTTTTAATTTTTTTTTSRTTTTTTTTTTTITTATIRTIDTTTTTSLTTTTTTATTTTTTTTKAMTTPTTTKRSTIPSKLFGSEIGHWKVKGKSGTRRDKTGFRDFL